MASQFRTLATLAALLFASVTTAQADYTYTTTVVPTTVPSVGLTITPVNGTQTDSLPINAMIATFAYNPTASGSGSTQLTITEVLSGTPGTSTIQILGTLSYTYQPGFVASTFVATSATVLSGSGYTINPLFANYVPTGTTGLNNALFLAIVPTATVAVPEPASVALLGLGLVGSIGVAARRRLARA